MYSNIKTKLEHGAAVEDLCFSLQETAFAMMMEICERALAYTNKREFVIVGGVGANKRLCGMAKEMADLRKITFKSFPLQYAMDNGVMIAWQGYLERDRANLSISGLKPLMYINVESEL
jgi:N6-L-threonylcarbamoyladenine synthase/protein kinase Bud32